MFRRDLVVLRLLCCLPVVSEEVYDLTLTPGRTITGEHGLGATRCKYLPLVLDDAQITVKRRVKESFDPNYTLNPGKIFQ